MVETGLPRMTLNPGCCNRRLLLRCLTGSSGEAVPCRR
jgi:hypothetical protein